MSRGRIVECCFKSQSPKGRGVMVRPHEEKIKRFELVYNVSLTSISEEIIVRKDTKKYRAFYIRPQKEYEILYRLWRTCNKVGHI